ncbi:class I SAM-dependent methyltransferase [Kiloniella majae]|uniref:class I SAM-dependent methyltransferase n=1 Tax=Kiloniella majae TaxID=1938558 RepID=UPI000A278866|nr:class I SAM-dependent methyltransferase [Kiloniella majae]
MIQHHDLPLGKIDYCQVCGSKNLHDVIDLGHQAPCDSLLWPQQLDEAEKTYPLRFQVCKSCSLGQIDYVVPAEELFFPDYPYRSGITATLVEKLSKTAVSTLGRFDFPEDSLVMDIGSNDGTVLRAFKERGMKVLGVEATNIAKIANENGIETIQAFFNEETAQEIVKSHGHAHAICATNVFAHIASMGSIIRGVETLLEEGGVFVTESHYLMDLLETVQYDSIYHEHLRYYTLKSLIYLFDQYGFTITDVERIPNYGGSIRVFAVKGTDHEVSSNVADLLAEEEAYGLYDTDVFDKFAARTRKARDDLQQMVLDIRSRGERVVGIACPGRSSTLVNYTSLNPDLMPYIAEQSTSLKLGLFLPGMHIPIVDEQRMFDEEPEYAIMLSWHYAEAICNNLRKKGLKSKIIVPLPEVHILEA